MVAFGCKPPFWSPVATVNFTREPSPSGWTIPRIFQRAFGFEELIQRMNREAESRKGIATKPGPRLLGRPQSRKANIGRLLLLFFLWFFPRRDPSIRKGDRIQDEGDSDVPRRTTENGPDMNPTGFPSAVPLNTNHKGVCTEISLHRRQLQNHKHKQFVVADKIVLRLRRIFLV